MLTPRRRIVLLALVVVVAAAAWSGWQLHRARTALVGADAAAQRLRAAVETGDPVARRDALGDLRVQAAAARERTGGAWWSAMTRVPLVGDDLAGVRAVGVSLDVLAADGIQPLADAVDDLDSLTSGGRVDLAALEELQEPMGRAAGAFATARSEVADLDSSGYAGPLRTRFDDYAAQVGDLARGVGSAARATEVLPGALGADGPRDYLLVFQNNAEVRPSGGLPGSWAQVRADDGRLSIEQQGSGAQFGRLDEPVLPLTEEELAVYTDLLGVFFLDANFTPDFPRAAELWRARWERDFAPTTLDGVVSLDPVALSYLLRATGPVEVDGVSITADNAVAQLLDEPYRRLDGPAQDLFFASAARAIFERVTRDTASPVELVRGMSRAADERRFLFTSYDESVASQVEGTRIAGALADDDGTEPHVEVTLTDATGSKMSYYLRYRTRVTSQSCADGVQALQGTMSLSQTLTQAQAAQLPESVTGPGAFGTEKGFQSVVVRIYSPTGGSMGPVRIDGAVVEYDAQPLEGREVATLIVQLDGPDDVLLNWSMESGPGQAGDGSVSVTPSVVAGSRDSTFASSC